MKGSDEMLNDMLDAVKQAEERAADIIAQAKAAAVQSGEAAQADISSEKENAAAQARNYADELKAALAQEEETLMSRSREEAEAEAGRLAAEALKKQEQINKMLEEVLFS